MVWTFWHLRRFTISWRCDVDPDSKDGRHLLLRSEFHGQSEYRTSALIARRTKDDPVMPQAKLICGIFGRLLLMVVPVTLVNFSRIHRRFIVKPNTCWGTCSQKTTATARAVDKKYSTCRRVKSQGTSVSGRTYYHERNADMVGIASYEMTLFQNLYRRAFWMGNYWLISKACL
jgi:hypothetical protein